MNAQNSPSRHFRQNSERTISSQRMPKQRKVFWCLRIQAFSGDRGSHRFFRMLTSRFYSVYRGPAILSRNFLITFRRPKKQMRSHPPRFLNNFTTITPMQSSLKRWRQQIMRNNPTYRYLLKEYYEGILLFEIMEKEVWNKAAEDSAGQHTYYKNHIADYQAGERAKTMIYSSNSKDVSIS